MTANEVITTLSHMLKPINNQILAINNEIININNQLAGVHKNLNNIQGQINIIENKIETMQDKIETMQDKIETMQDKIETMQVDILELKSRTKKIELTQENIILPRLQNIEACYTSTFKKYQKSVDEHESMKQDISVLKTVVSEHSLKLQRIS